MNQPQCQIVLLQNNRKSRTAIATGEEDSITEDDLVEGKNMTIINTKKAVGQEEQA